MFNFFSQYNLPIPLPFFLHYTHLSRSELQNFTITGLSPGGLYIIYVTASLGNGKSFSYQLLKIRTSTSCGSGGNNNNNSSINISRKYAKYNLMKYEIFGKNWSPEHFSNDLKN